MGGSKMYNAIEVGDILLTTEGKYGRVDAIGAQGTTCAGWPLLQPMNGAGAPTWHNPQHVKQVFKPVAAPKDPTVQRIRDLDTDGRLARLSDEEVASLYTQYSHDTSCAGWLDSSLVGVIETFYAWATTAPCDRGKV
jgi:hypothetical protein